MKTNNFTKVVCGNCGAEVVIPSEEKVVAGKAVGKNSGLGTIVLPTYKTPQQEKQQPVGCGKCQDYDTESALNTIRMTVQGDERLLKMIDNITVEIKNGGWVDVKGIVRRWVPSQFLRMFFSEKGFHQSLKSKGHDYSWKVLVNDIEAQVKSLKKGDASDLSERMSFYNPTVACFMAEDYIKELSDWYKQAPTKKCKGKTYKKLHCQLNNGRGVFTKEFNLCVIAPLVKKAAAIHNAEEPAELLKAVLSFLKSISSISFTPQTSNAFMNAYKAAGTYYTLKDLILFENCIMEGADGKISAGDTALERLNVVTKDIVSEGVHREGYRMLGVAKSFLKYNSFDYNKTVEEWKEQSEVRRAERVVNRARRNNK